MYGFRSTVDSRKVTDNIVREEILRWDRKMLILNVMEKVKMFAKDECIQKFGAKDEEKKTRKRKEYRSEAKINN